MSFRDPAGQGPQPAAEPAGGELADTGDADSGFMGSVQAHEAVEAGACQASVLGDPGAAARAGGRWAAIRPAIMDCLATAGIIVAAGVAAGFLWSAIAPRPLLVMTGPGAADVVNAETSAFIGADGWYVLICLAAGIACGVFGYAFAVRKHGPAAMATILLSAVAAALITMTIGQHLGLAHYQHLMTTLRSGAQLRGSLVLGAGSAIAFWPLGAGAAAGGIELRRVLTERAAAAAMAADASEAGDPGAVPGPGSPGQVGKQPR